MSQNNLASLWSRVGAALIDLIIIFIFIAIVTFSWGMAEGLRQVSVDEFTWKTRGTLVALAVDLIYTVALMASAKHSTYGQRALGIRVRKLNGTDVGFSTALGRYLVSLVSSILLKLGFLIAVFTKHKQTLHDLAAGTIVVYDVEPQSGESADIPMSEAGARSSDEIASPQRVVEATPMPHKAAPTQAFVRTVATNEIPGLAALSDEALYELALNEIKSPAAKGLAFGLWP